MAEKIYEIPAEWMKRAYIDDAKYKAMYERSIKDPDGFWREEANCIHWFKPFTKVKNTSFDPHNVFIKWFEDGTTNVAYNCLDRHLDKRGDQVAILWEGDDPKEDRRITYRELHAEVCRFANVLKRYGVKRGDRVTIYLSMIPELAIAMLACARIGAIHSVVFGGFSPDSLAGRIADARSTIMITADEGVRGGRKIPLKANADAAADKAGGVTTMIVVRRTGAAEFRVEVRGQHLKFLNGLDSHGLARGATNGVAVDAVVGRPVHDKIVHTRPCAVKAQL